jgi:catechol 2,3-dioxygenase-like lactoylglutathione lyase family enzyme/predicted enzyme related to lactoylglutathione lyase
MSWGLISEMGYVALQTSQIAESVSVATGILGLHETRATGGRTYLAASSTAHHELIYVESDSDGVDHLGLVAASAEALREIYRRVQAANFTIVSSDVLVEGIAEGFAFVGPEGFVFSIYRGMSATRHVATPNFGPDRYGHVNLHPVNIGRMKDFLVNILDFRVSDVIGDDYAYFLRCNPDHHGIALIPGRGTLHHHAWQTQSIADLGKLADRLDAVGRRLIWGPVRHGAGHNIAAYFVEPTGAVIELYTDLEQIYDADRPPITWDGDDGRWFNRWGTYNGQDFRSHGLLPTMARE